MFRLNESCKQKLLQAGWSESYCTDPEPHLRWNEEGGYPRNPFAEEFFTYFGGLYIPVTDGVETAEFSTNVANVQRDPFQLRHKVRFAPGEERFCVCGGLIGYVVQLKITERGNYVVQIGIQPLKINYDNAADALCECLNPEWFDY